MVMMVGSYRSSFSKIPWTSFYANTVCSMCSNMCVLGVG